MTSDEVVLRRQRSIDENGCVTIEPPPPPRLRGQSTYLALLSSLATDLDIMLNDLRSSPSSRLLPSATASTQSSSSPSPATVGGTSASSAFLRNNQSVQIIPSQSVSTTTTRVASPIPEHRYHHYYYQQQHQTHRLNQDFFCQRFQTPNSNLLRSNGLRSGVAHAPTPTCAPASSTSVSSHQSSRAVTTTSSSHHQTSATSTTSVAFTTILG